jgi:hypothetical protein
MPFLKAIVLILLFAHAALAQPFRIQGKVIESDNNEPIIGATIKLLSGRDSSQLSATASNESGEFTFTVNRNGRFIINVSAIGFVNQSSMVFIRDNDAIVPAIKLKNDTKLLESVTVESKQIRVEQNGDTTAFRADAFKTNPDASAEDLISKMPGITTEGGIVKVGGEEVKRVLIDGKQFFGDDPNIALKNLPADVIAKIQVFDQASDQSRFTGISDGNEVRTINIITKPGRNTGKFGRVYAGYGENDYYNAGLSLNSFEGNEKISIVGLANNVNQQNFSGDDLSGIASSGQSRGGPMRGMMGGMMGRPGGMMGGGGAGDPSSFMVNQQNGIATTQALGINYINEWKKTKFSASYFLNRSDRITLSDVNRQFILAGDSGLAYRENSIIRAENFSHRLNSRIEYTIDSMQSITFTPQFNIGVNETLSDLNGFNFTGNDNVQNSINNTSISDNSRLSGSGSLLYRLKFRKPRRTFSANVNYSINQNEGDNELLSSSFFPAQQNTFTVNQQGINNNESLTLSPSLTFTEPLGKKSSLMVDYSPSFNINNSERITNRYNPADDAYNVLDSLLSNRFDNTYTAQKAGVTYNFNTEKLTIMLGSNYQVASLRSLQNFPINNRISRDFYNVLPYGRIMYKFSKNASWRAFYRSYTNAPSINQLQNVIDNSNPLFLNTGNPDLVQSVSHMLVSRLSITNSATAQSFFVVLFGSVTNNFIGNSSTIALTDTMINSIRLRQGSQLTQPVNINGAANFRSFVTWGLPLSALKSNFNLNASMVYNQTPSLINNLKNYARNYNLSQGFTISSNVSEKIDFSLSYNANYSIVRNELQPAANNNFFFHTVTAKMNLIFGERVVFNTQATQTLFSGLAEGFDNTFTMVNAGLGYKFLKNKSLEARISVFDILNQNNAIARNVTETFIEDNISNVIRRYVMFTATYTLKQFGGASKPSGDNSESKPAKP